MDDQVTCRRVPSEATGAARLRRVEGGRQHVLKVKLDDAEYAAITERASALKVSLQRLLVSCALAPRSPASGQASAKVPPPVLAELTGLRRLTANLANNINQIARTLNSGGSPGTSIPAAADAVRRAMIRLDSVLAVVGSDLPDRPAARSVHPAARSVPSASGPTDNGSSRPPRIIPEAPP